MSRLEDAKRNLRAASEAADPERHLRALAERLPVTAFALGLAVGLALATLPSMRRGFVRAVLAPPEATPRSLPRKRSGVPSPPTARR